MNAHEQDSWITLPAPVAYDALVEPPYRDPKLKPHAQAVSAFAAALEVGNNASSFTVNLNQFSVEWGYAAVRLPSAAPALIVETTRARAETPLPALPEVGRSADVTRTTNGTSYGIAGGVFVVLAATAFLFVGR